MRNILALLPLIFGLLVLSACQSTTNTPTDETDSTSPTDSVASTHESMATDTTLDSLFANRGIKGVVILGLSPGVYTSNNWDRAEKRLCPASTYKIFNSLVGLESKAVEDVNEIIKWDRVERSYHQWNKDHNLRSAIKYSCVWFYQEIARRVGRETMQMYLDSLPYGNGTIGEKVDEFWLDGSLQISAMEQIKFLERLVNYDVPFNKRTVDLVKDIMIVEKGDTFSVHAKTGWSIRLDEQIGWYVGYVKKADKVYPFAVNIDMKGQEDTRYRKEIAYRALELYDILYLNQAEE